MKIRTIPSAFLLCSLLAFGLSALLGPFAFADRATIDPTKTQIALPLSTPPTIDGTINTDEWNRAGGFANDFWRVAVNPDLADGVLGGVIGVGTAPADNDDLSFRIYAGYDSENLYVGVRVTDSILQEDSAAADSVNGNTWEDDSVEVFVDGDNSNAARWAAGQPGGQYVITVNNAYRENEAGNPGYGATAAWFAKTSRTDTGYDAEFRISLATLGNPKPGDIIGFTVAVNDDDDGGGTDRQLLWVGAAHEPVNYGNLMINGRSYTAPKTAAPVIDGTINASEYAGAAEIKIDGVNGIYDNTSGDNTWEATDHFYSAWVIHDAEAIYVAVNVTDDNVLTDTAEAGSEDQATWEDDSIEIFFDPNNSKDSGRGAEQFEGQYVLSANGAWRDNEANNPTFGQTEHWFAATTKTATGFAIEFKVKKSAILNPADGTSIGFHIALNDDDGSLPAPKMQLGWSGYAHAEYTYGTLNLGGETTPGNAAPTVAITAPANAATFTAPANISITAAASDTDGSISKVEFFAGATLIGTSTTSPYSITWSNVAAGAYALTAKATDNQGGSKVSAAVSITVSSGAPPVAQTVSVNFQGRISPGPTSTDPLAPTDVAGVVAVGNWNNVPDADVAEAASCYEGSPTGALVDSTGAATTITLTFSANGGWNNEATATTTANAKMMHGIIKQSVDDPDNCVASGTFTFNNVPEGQYDLYVYLNTDADNQAANISDKNNLTTYYINEVHQFNDGATFVQGLNTDPNGTRDTCSYVKFSNLGTLGSGSIGFSAKPIGGTSYTGVGIAGIQLVKIPPPAPVGGQFTGIRVEANNVIITFTGSGVQSASAVTGPWTDVAGTSPLTVPVADGPKFYRFSQVSAPAPAVCITTPAINTWVNTPFANQTGIFTATFDATPSLEAPFDSVMALSSGPKTNFPDFACLVRFNTDGIIDARNGGAYAPLPGVIPYSANVKYHFRLVVNVPAGTYSIYVTPAGGVEQTVGTDFAFRPTAGTVTKLDNWGVIVDITSGSNTVCDFKVVP